MAMELSHHYVYGITHRWTSKRYIGAKSCFLLPKDNIGVEYFSSSTDKDFREELKLYPERFIFEVLKEFDTREEALLYEIELHERYDVRSNNDFYNLSNQAKNGFTAFGRTHTDDQKKEISKRMLGSNNPQYGKEHTEEHKEIVRRKIKNKVWMYNEELDKSRRIDKDKVQFYLDTGWILKFKTKSTKGMIHIYDPITKDSKTIKEKEWLLFKNLGWLKGNLTARGRTKIYHPILNATKFIFKEEIPSFIKDGWIIGAGKSKKKGKM